MTISFNHLIDGWDDRPCLCKGFEVRHTPVANTNCLYRARVVQSFHLLPSVFLVPSVIYRTRAVRIHRQQLIRVVWN